MIKMKHARRDLSCFSIVVALAWAGVASGQDAAVVTGAAPAPANVWVASTGPWLAVGDRQLDAMRGGFDVGNGLLASFGIGRVVYVNGSLVASTSVSVPDIGRMTPAQAGALATAMGTSVIQVGPGNTFSPSTLDRAVAATVIQNSLDNQDIRSLTTIDASVNNLGQFRSGRLADTLQTALINSLGH